MDADSDPSQASYVPLRSVNAVAAHIPFIEDARERVTAEMQAMVMTGLATLVRFSFHLECIYD